MTDTDDRNYDTPARDGPTDAPPADGAASTDGQRDRMGDVDHTHPHRNTTFGSIFGRGPTVAADGGEPCSDGGTPASARAEGLMADVNHESPTGTDASGAFERGEERTAVTERDVVTDE